MKIVHRWSRDDLGEMEKLVVLPVPRALRFGVWPRGEQGLPGGRTHHSNVVVAEIARWIAENAEIVLKQLDDADKLAAKGELEFYDRAAKKPLKEAV